MIYLNKTDLIAASFERFIDESSQDTEGVIDVIESENIELIKNYLGTRYNVEAIFNELEPIKNGILSKILVRLVLFDLFRRNAPRKLPQDIRDDYDKAISQLEKISTGRLPIDGLPVAVDDTGKPRSNSMWGNNSNKDLYI